MKKILTVALALVLMLSLSVTAFADILWEPDNLFLKQHREECPRIDRSYRTLTEVTVYQSPEDSTVMWTIPEGESWRVYYTYEDDNGNLWGCLEKWEFGETGWIPLAYTELVYDYISFEEDYGHLFEDPDDWVYLDESYAELEIWFWNYPGSDSGDAWTVEAKNMPAFELLYTDALDRVWGYVGYHMGFRNVWICISDPTADYDTLYPAGPTPEVSVTIPSVPDPTLPAEEIVPQISQKTREVYIIITIGVIGCVVVSGAMLLRTKKKHGFPRKEEGEC